MSSFELTMGVSMLSKLSAWWRRLNSDFPRPLSNHNLKEYEVRNNVFFRVDNQFLCDINTASEDVYRGSAVLHWICCRIVNPWQVHEITMSVWQGSLVATIGISEHVLFQLHFLKFDDGWLLSIDPFPIAMRGQIRNFITTINNVVTSIPAVRDVRWFYDETLTCGCLHVGDFELGAESPFG